MGLVDGRDPNGWIWCLDCDGAALLPVRLVDGPGGRTVAHDGAGEWWWLGW